MKLEIQCIHKLHRAPNPFEHLKEAAKEDWQKEQKEAEDLGYRIEAGSNDGQNILIFKVTSEEVRDFPPGSTIEVTVTPEEGS